MQASAHAPCRHDATHEALPLDPAAKSQRGDRASFIAFADAPLITTIDNLWRPVPITV